MVLSRLMKLCRFPLGYEEGGGSKCGIRNECPLFGGRGRWFYMKSTGCNDTRKVYASRVICLLLY